MIQRTPTDPKQKVLSLDQLKTALGFIGRSDKDDELTIILNSAITEIEEVANVSLRDYSVVVSYDWPKAVNSLYLHPVADVISVKSAQGDDIDYTLDYSKQRVTLNVPQSCTIEYTTKAVENGRDRYIDAVVNLSMYKFNRETDTAQRNAILRSVL